MKAKTESRKCDSVFLCMTKLESSQITLMAPKGYEPAFPFIHLVVLQLL